MKITLTDAGKRFNRDWIFRHLSYEFITGHSYAITGPNGSGKSTLLQVIAGAIASSEGNILYEFPVSSFQFSVPKYSSTSNSKPETGNRQLETENIYQYLSIAAPYLEVIEEMTLMEFLQFHQIFKPFISSVNIEKIISIVGLGKAAHKQIRYYSSGMKQRVKLAQAIFSGTQLLLLDEPCTNLDVEGIALYRQLIKDYCNDRLVIVSSNDEQEYEFCEMKIDILDYKR